MLTFTIANPGGRLLEILDLGWTDPHGAPFMDLHNYARYGMTEEEYHQLHKYYRRANRDGAISISRDDITRAAFFDRIRQLIREDA